ncbi:cytochrome c oxidase subunit II [Carboxylicivirga sp. N1Y90]|uniref:cytochrome c oxidase subunit II n=1 Tax=Carboxylicivirga fragile TaxID=3417571 RepID=UPI003D329A40|nr:cytochrome c oxidase subunit II [Marinilabiliaceae bacterium N1Y90]
MIDKAQNASTFVSEVDSAFLFIFGVALFFLFAITAVLIYYIIRYRQSKNPKATHIEGSTKLEIIWTVVPTILVLVMFSYGWSGWKSQTEIPDDAMPVKAIARMWSFAFEYENGLVTDTLIVPKGRAVKLDLVAQDVIHSMYIPAFRVKQDMVPGKKSNIWFESERIGTYEIFCAEYCGLRHSYMMSGVKVIEGAKFDKWMEENKSIEEANKGTNKRLAGVSVLRKYGCNACHTIDGSKLVGPSYKGVLGSTRTVITDGKEREVFGDEAYIRRSIYEPNADVVKGYDQGLMLSYKDQVTEEELQHLIEYFKSLSE